MDSILQPVHIDRVALALIGIAKELWVVKDRQIITEAFLREKNIIAELDTYQPGPELAARLGAERERFLGALASTLFDQRPSATAAV